jgi:tetratricopeptide (TPR) repeat protein
VAKSTAELTAQQHFKEGEQRYGARQFQAALDEYQAGFTILPLPGFLVNIGQCYRRMGDLPHARSTFQRFVLAAPDSPLVPEIRELISEIDRQQRSAYLDTPEVLPLSYGGSESEEAGGTTTHAPGPIISSAALRASPPAPAAPSGALIDMQVEAGSDAEARSGGDVTHTSVDEGSSSSWSNHRWWLWGGLAAAVIGGSVTAYLALSAPNTVVLHDGTLGSLRR